LDKTLRKPHWLKSKIPSGKEYRLVRDIVEKNKLHTICTSGHCPNMDECWGRGTATLMILGDICTRSCGFCNVKTGRPLEVDLKEPERVGNTVNLMKLKHCVLTSVDRDDLKDGGATHFSNCITAIRDIKRVDHDTKIEILVPDFRGREERALNILTHTPPDIFNHNLETVPRLYRKSRPGASYSGSLELLKTFSILNPTIPTKSGIMLGLGESIAEVKVVMQDLRNHNVSRLTLGQYLQPTRHHLPVDRFVTPDEFNELKLIGDEMGFENVASGPMVRSSYHADLQDLNAEQR
jgi:lipoic acid synthetase